MSDYMEEYEKLEKLKEELRVYVELDGTEYGEISDTLMLAAGYESYVSDEFYAALVKELEAQLKNFKENCVIRERNEIINKTYKELEWQ